MTGTMIARRRTAGLVTWILVAGAAMAGGCATAGRDPAQINVSIRAWADADVSGRLIRTDHFDIISTLQDAALEDALPAFLEAAYRRYEVTFPATAARERLVTYVFGSRGQWTRFAADRYPVRFDLYRRIRTGGFTEGATSVSFHTSRASTLATLAHEGWHQYVNARCSRPIPAWLNEGLACYHEAIDHTGPVPRFTPTRNTFRRNSLREAIQRKQTLSLRELLATDAGAVVGKGGGELAPVYYAQSWALITFLRHGPERQLQAAFGRLLADIANGAFDARVGAARLTEPELAGDSPGVAAFHTYFAITPESLDGSYGRYMAELTGLSSAHSNAPK